MDMPSTSSQQQDGSMSYMLDEKDRKVQDKIEFVRIVGKYRNVLFPEYGTPISQQASLKEKEDIWKQIGEEAKSLKSFQDRPWQRLRDHDWQYVRRHALNRYENKQPKVGGLIGVLDELVLEVITGTKANRRMTSMNMSYTEDSADDYQFLLNTSKDDEKSRDSNSSRTSPVTGEQLATVKTEPQSSAMNTFILPSSSNNETLMSFINGLPNGTNQFAANRPCLDSSAEESVHVDCSLSNSPSDSVHPKRKRVLSSTHSSVDQRVKELQLKKLELETSNLELQKQKLERELFLLEEQEKRQKELHSIDLKRAKLGLARMESLVL